jgi:predicted transglutaminase-like cysteine proteinase
VAERDLKIFLVFMSSGQGSGRITVRQAVKIAAITAAMLAFVSQQIAEASFFGLPRSLNLNFTHIQLEAPALPPFAHTRFCLQYPADCEVRGIAFRGGGLRLTLPRWVELIDVNREVNRAIAPEPNFEGLAAERWLLHPRKGDCNDYAVTKRHELIKRGWPSRALLLAEVVTTWGEHHLVLVVRTKEGDYVADSLHPQVRRWAETPYRWMRVQSPQNPMFWATVGGPTV